MQEDTPVKILEAACRCEAQRVLAALRANRKFGDLSRGWRELEDDSPIRQLSEWRCRHHATAVSLLKPLLDIVRSPEFAGPTTHVALEAVHAVVIALCDAEPTSADLSGVALGAILAEVSDAVCECIFAETHSQVDEATTMQMVTVLGFCATVDASLDVEAFPAEKRLRAFARILSLWGHYQRSPTLRNGAQSSLQRMLDFACCHMDVQAPFMQMVLQRILEDVAPEVSQDRLVLYLRFLQRLSTHPIAQRCIAEKSPHAQMFQNNVPLLLMAVGEHFGTNVRVLALLLPIVNQICWLCIGNWQEAHGAPSSGVVAGLGALQLEALLSSIYIRIMALAAAPLQAADTTVLPLTAEEGTEVLVLLLEALCDLCQPHTVRTVWYSFDLDWRRPALLEQLVRSIEALFQDSPSTERPLPAYVVHLSATVLTHIISAFNFLGDDPLSSDEHVGPEEDGLAQIKEQRRRRALATKLLEKMVDKPKKTKAALEDCGILDIIDVAREQPSQAAASSASAAPIVEDGIVEVFDDWSVKLAWLLRCLNHCVPYEAMGEFFGQNSKDSEMAFAAFVDSFDWGGRDMVEALRGMLLAFLIPKEAQQIDRVLKIFAYTFYRKQREYCQSAGDGVGYFRHPDAAYTMAFSMMMLNTDQHNPRLKKRMTFMDFKRNNRGINEGADIPEEVLQAIFESIHKCEIKTPSSGSLVEGVSASRWADLMHLVERGYRDNSLMAQHQHLSAHALALFEGVGECLRNALESAFATDPGAHSDAVSGLGSLLRLTLALQLTEADAVTEGLFFFGTEVFHEPQRKGGWGRASVSLRALFQSSLAHAACLSTKQLHMLVYITIQFALYGLIDRATALPPLEPVTSKLLRTPSLAVDPPTGVVYSFLRKISTVPFRVLSFTEDPSKVDDANQPDDEKASSDNVAVKPLLTDGQQAAAVAEAQGTQEKTPEAKPENELPKEALAAPVVDPGSPAGDEASVQEITSWPQIEQTFDTCGLDLFLRSLLSPWLSQDGEEADASPMPQFKQMGSRAFFSFVSSLFLALRVAAPSKPSKDKDQDLPVCFEEESKPEVATPQALQLPKRALALNVLDGFETLRLGLRLLQCAIGNRQVVHRLAQEDVAVVQELSVHIHMGLAHTLRRSDLCERTLRVSVVSIFQIASALLSLRTSEGPVVSLGWPIRLIDILVQRTATEPQLLVPVAKLSMEMVRIFVMEVSKHRALNQMELWRHLFQFLLKAVPTAARAMWPGTKDALVASVQMQLWQQGLVWLLGHPCLLSNLANECPSPESGTPEGPAAAAFWTWSLGELMALADEMIPGNRPEAARLLSEAYKVLLGYLVIVPEPSNGSEDPSSARSAQLAVHASAWSRVAVSLLGCSGALLTRPAASNDSDQPLVLLLKQALLNVRVPQLLGSTAQGPYWARATLEKLVSVLTTAASAGAPIPCLREAVGLVAKFFLQNLQVLQRHECFSQLWLMVLRLMLLFIKRGSEGHDELEEIATETLKNLLCVLLNTKVLGFVSPKGGAKDSPTHSSDVPVWWQMTWDCIEVFLPGFGEEFAGSMLPKTGAAQAGAEAASAEAAGADQADASPAGVAPREDVGPQSDNVVAASANQEARGKDVSDAADSDKGPAGGAPDKEANSVAADSVSDEPASKAAGDENW